MINHEDNTELSLTLNFCTLQVGRHFYLGGFVVQFLHGGDSGGLHVFSHDQITRMTQEPSPPLQNFALCQKQQSPRTIVQVCPRRFPVVPVSLLESWSKAETLPPGPIAFT
ncbi:hypothetical protein AVEN_157485-1 [Araneus ventricosus]|uniref:Uncharacterized protein n=1 Tax=Araneus ventricosus TaxID=182803 RepID=A0A4Y2RPT5_ARAVE|nr:hypothetical protein AVEN_157485-1 [Araneus ventricosus]